MLVSDMGKSKLRSPACTISSGGIGINRRSGAGNSQKSCVDLQVEPK